LKSSVPGNDFRKLIVFISVFSIFLVVFGGVASASTGDLQVFVYDKYGEPIEDATVKCYYNNNNTVLDTDTTNSRGEAECNNLKEDKDYEVLVTHDYYQDIRDNADNFVDGDELKIYMRPKTVDLVVEVEDEAGDEVRDAEVKLIIGDRGKVHRKVDSFAEIYNRDTIKDTNSRGEATFRDLETDTEYNLTVSKAGYITSTASFDLSLKDSEDDEVRLQNPVVLVKPGFGSVVFNVRDAETAEPLEGVHVVLTDSETGEQIKGTTDAQGRAEFLRIVPTPRCYILSVSKERYGSKSTTTPQCLKNNNEWTQPFSLSKQNSEPTANAGSDLFIMEGDTVTLDGTGSSDPDGDTLSYSWVDNLGTEIPNTANPTVTFNTVGTHVITLTVTDTFDASSTDQVVVEVESFSNCGNNECSTSERESGTCPVDCPVCGDAVCGVNEVESCPMDCGIGVVLRMPHKNRVGNLTHITTLDSHGNVLPLVLVSITTPNGTKYSVESNLTGDIILYFNETGNFTLTATKESYISNTTNIIIGKGLFDFLFSFGGVPKAAMYVVYVLLAGGAVLLVLVAIRYVNLKRRGKKFTLYGSRQPGYKKGKYRRRKSTLESL